MSKDYQAFRLVEEALEKEAGALRVGAKIVGDALRFGGKFVGLGAKGVGKSVYPLAWLAGKGAKGAFNLGGKGLYQAYDKAVKPVINQSLKNRLPKSLDFLEEIPGFAREDSALALPTKILLASATVPSTLAMTGIDNYWKKMEQPYKSSIPRNFGTPKYEIFSYNKYSSERASEMKNITEMLIKEAGVLDSLRAIGGKVGGYLSDTGAILGKALDPTYVSGVDHVGRANRVFEPKIDPVLGARKALGLAAAAPIAYTVAPTIKSYGDILRDKLIPIHQRVNAEEEMERAKAKAMADFHAMNAVKELESQRAQQKDIPHIHSILAALKESDPLIQEASKDKHLNTILDQTVQTVYNFAPSIAKDPRALQSVLTEAVSSPDGGLSFQTIKSLADAQKAISAK